MRDVKWKMVNFLSAVSLRSQSHELRSESHHPRAARARLRIADRPAGPATMHSRLRKFGTYERRYLCDGHSRRRRFHKGLVQWPGTHGGFTRTGTLSAGD